MTGVLAGRLWEGLGGDAGALDGLGYDGVGALSSAFAVSDLAAASIGVAGLAVAKLCGEVSGALPEVRVDRRLASFWFAGSIRPVGWALPGAWDPVAGDYACADGWIRLHTNAPRHRAAALEVLGVSGDREAVGRAVACWTGDALEEAIVAAGGCAAAMRSVGAWRAHDQGRAVGSEPLVRVERREAAGLGRWRPGSGQPLAGLRVLDLTRVLAGPVATRFLAGFGADVLRVDPPGWDEPGVAPEVTLGKRCVRLDFATAEGRLAFEGLLGGADVLVLGYRPGALDGVGFSEEVRRGIAPGLIEVTLDAYGWTGPWAGRRGFDSLVQMSSGIAEAGMRWRRTDRPVPLPVQALDHATGYLIAAAAVMGVRDRVSGRGAAVARLSLARTAAALIEVSGSGEDEGFAPETEADLAPGWEATDWGGARRLRAPLSIEGLEPGWERPARRLGSVGRAEWLA